MSSVSQARWGNPFFVLFVLLPFLLVVYLLIQAWLWLQANGGQIWSNIHVWVIGIAIALTVAGLTWAGWKIYNSWSAHADEKYARRLDLSLREQELLAKQHHNQIAHESHQLIFDARTNMDNVDIEYTEGGAIASLKVIRSRENMQSSLLIQQLQQQVEELKQATLQIAAPDAEKSLIPTAPKFLEMCHLITAEKAPLCFDVNGPVYGTVHDLLSMAVSGKPGRGKTTALMYYVAFLLRCGAEVWIFDPHGTMGELAKLNGQVLANMPATAKVVYLDRQQDMVNAVPVLMNELNVRDELYRPAHEVKHPLLVLADELPVIAEFDADVIQEWKAEDKAERDAHPLTFARLFKKFVLEARKWNCYFIGSGQTFDAETLPKKVTDNLNSRIVFFSSDQRARMSGLENDAIKNLLPVIRRAGSGVMVFDCSRFDAPIMGAIPYITVDDLMTYLGVTGERSGNRSFELKTLPNTPPARESQRRPTIIIEAPQYAPVQRSTGALENPVNALVDDAGMTPDEFPALGNDDLMMTDLQVQQFMVLYPVIGNIVECLKQINNGKGQGLGKRYFKHASWIVKQHGLKKESR